VTRTLRTILALAILTATAHASSLSGTVTNKTNNRPAAGDDVVLIRLAQGMQESTRTTTDSRGRYTLDVPDEGVHLVRVTHDKANYFTPVPAGTDTADVTVYDAAAHVAGITGEADVMRIESDGSGTGLHVVENFFVKNDSAPPRTQFSPSPFDFYLPEGAVIEESAALGPGSMPVKAAPVPLSDAKNHYAFIFPIRPGETRFQLGYRLPYSGTFNFAPRPMLATDTVAIMLPKSMTIKLPDNSPFAAVSDEVNAQTFVARGLPADRPIPFTISGSGQLPRDTQNADNSGSASSQSGNAQPDAGAQGGGPDDNRPGGGLGKPIDTPDPLSKYKWWIIGGLLLLMAGIAGFLVSKPSATAAPAPPNNAIDTTPMPIAPLSGRSTLDALKEELFTLETDRLSGKMDEAEYAEHKAALETILKRALKRG